MHPEDDESKYYSRLLEDKTIGLEDYDIDFFVRRVVSRGRRAYSSSSDFEKSLLSEDSIFWENLRSARTGALLIDPREKKGTPNLHEPTLIKILDGIQRDPKLSPRGKRVYGDLTRFFWFVNTPDVSGWYDIAGNWLNNEAESKELDDDDDDEKLLRLLISNYELQTRKKADAKHATFLKHFSYYIEDRVIPHNQFQTLINRAAAISGLPDFTYENHMELQTPLAMHETYDEIKSFFEHGDTDGDDLFTYRGLINYILSDGPIMFKIFSVRKIADLVVDYASRHVVDILNVTETQYDTSQRYKELWRVMIPTKDVYKSADPRTLFLNLTDLPDHVLEGIRIERLDTYFPNLDSRFLVRPFLVSYDDFAGSIKKLEDKKKRFAKILAWAPFVLIPHALNVRMDTDLNVKGETDSSYKSYRARRFIFFRSIANHLRSKDGDVKPLVWERYKPYASSRS